MKSSVRACDRLRKVRREMDSPCAILLDTKGPEIRTGELAGHKPVQLMAGNSFTFTEADVEGGDRVVSRKPARVCADVVSLRVRSSWSTTGLIELAVDSVEGGDIHCTVQNSGLLRRAQIHEPSRHVAAPAGHDRPRPRRPAVRHRATASTSSLRPSFAMPRACARCERSSNEHGGGDIMFLSKIECHEAVENINEIIEASDGIMIARGDLGVEVPALTRCRTSRRRSSAPATARRSPSSRQRRCSTP